MRKREFLEELRSRLSSLPKNEVDDRIDFYDEMIDDMIDEGKTEEEAIEAIGGIDGVMKKIAQDTSIVTIVKEKIKPKRSLRAWEVILLILGFPLWFPLVLTFLILSFVGYVLLWVLVIVTYSVEVTLISGTALAFIKFFVEIGEKNLNVGFIGISLLCLGGAILMFYACIMATKLSFKISKSILVSIKTKLIGGR